MRWKSGDEEAAGCSAKHIKPYQHISQMHTDAEMHYLFFTFLTRGGTEEWME